MNLITLLAVIFHSSVAKECHAKYNNLKAQHLLLTIPALLNSLQTKLCTSTLCTLAAHAVHVIVAPQRLTVNIQRRNFFIVLETVQLLFSLVQIS